VSDLKLTLLRDGAPGHEGRDTVDVVATVGPGLTVGELAAALAVRDPDRASGPDPARVVVTLAVDGPDGGPLPPDATVARVGPRSGARVRLVPASGLYPITATTEQVGVLEVLAGPDAGRDPFPLRPGVTVVGRDRDCDVRLTDELVSKQHARIVVGDVVEIMDMGSANGVYLHGQRVERAQLRPGDQPLLGDSLIRVTVRAAPGQTHLRPPHVVPRYAGVTVDAPTPPLPPARRRLPVLGVAVPVTVGVALLALTDWVYAWWLVLFGPVVGVIAYAEDAWLRRREYAAAVAAYRTSLATFDARLGAAADTERAGRAAEHPAAADLLAAARRLDPLLWSRRPGDDAFLELRLGLGARPSRNRIAVRARSEAAEHLWDELRAVVQGRSAVDGVPVAVRLTDAGVLGVAGHGGGAVPLAHGLLAQLATLHAPADLRLCAVASPAAAAQWRWLAWLPHTAPGPFAAPLATGAEASSALLDDVDALLARRAAGEARFPAVVLLVADDAVADRSRLVELCTHGPRLGVYVIWVAPLLEQLPGECGAYVQAQPGLDGGPVTLGTVGIREPGELLWPVTVEPLAPDVADDLGRRLAPIVDAGAPTPDDAPSPLVVRTLTFGPGELWAEPSLIT
jgi:DNA segregation ATPase FtsK/SpoIIIE, S-DNA-T family